MHASAGSFPAPRHNCRTDLQYTVHNPDLMRYLFPLLVLCAEFWLILLFSLIFHSDSSLYYIILYFAAYLNEFRAISFFYTVCGFPPMQKHSLFSSTSKVSSVQKASPLIHTENPPAQGIFSRTIFHVSHKPHCKTAYSLSMPPEHSGPPHSCRSSLR